MGGQFDYRVESFNRAYLSPGAMEAEVRNNFEIKYSSENVGDLSPLVNFEDIDTSCGIFYNNGNTIPKESSLVNLITGNTTAYFRSGRKLYFKLEAKNPLNNNRRSDTYNAFSSYKLDCQDGVD